MNFRQGTYRKVFIFNRYVIKIPKNFRGILVNINEIYNWHIYKELKYIMCPILFHDILGLFIVMRRANPYLFNINTDISLTNILNKHKIIQENDEYNHPVLDDLNENNFGFYDNRLVKIDYGNSYWLYNICINIRNFYLKHIRA